MGTRFQVSSGTLWNAFWNAFGTRSERKWNANGTRSERVPDAFRTQMERERSVRLFLSSTVNEIQVDLPEGIIQTLFQEVNPCLESTMFGIDLYQIALDLVENMLSI